MARDFEDIDYEKIEAFLHNELPEEAHKLFEKEVLKNPKLQEEVDMYRLMETSLEDQDAIQMREKLQGVIQKEQQPPTNQNNYLKIAAAVVLLITVAWFLIDNMISDRSLFDDYYVAYLSEPVTRGEQKKSDLIKLYDQGSYQEAAAGISKMLDDANVSSEEKDQYALYLGNCYLNTGETNKAIKQFQLILPASKRYEFAQWYLSMAYLKSNQVAQAIQTLNAVKEYDGLYKKKAIELMEKLD